MASAISSTQMARKPGPQVHPKGDSIHLPSQVVAAISHFVDKHGYAKAEEDLGLNRATAHAIVHGTQLTLRRPLYITVTKALGFADSADPVARMMANVGYLAPADLQLVVAMIESLAKKNPANSQ